MATENKTKKFIEKFTENEEKIINEIYNNPNITQEELSNILGITRRAVAKILKNLKEKNIIKRIGSDRKGYWEILL